MGYLTINGLAAANIVLVPVGTTFMDFDSTGQFFDMLHATFGSIETAKRAALIWPSGATSSTGNEKTAVSGTPSGETDGKTQTSAPPP